MTAATHNDAKPEREAATAPSPMRRAEQILRQEIDFIDNEAFRQPQAERHILGEGGAPSLLALPKEGSLSPNRDLPAHLARLCDAELLTAQTERELFQQMNFLKFRASRLRAQLTADEPDVDLMHKVETYLLAAEVVRDQIIRANMRLVISIVKKFVSPQFSFDELLSDGIMTLMNTVEKFDYDRGFRFSTYAYRSITRNAYRKVMERKKEMARYASTAEESIEGSIEDQGTPSMNEKLWERLRGLLADFMDQLDKRERMIVKARYALGRHRNVQTFQSIADKLGVSKERVRQLEQRAVGKLQAMAREHSVDPAV